MYRLTEVYTLGINAITKRDVILSIVFDVPKKDMENGKGMINPRDMP